MVPEGFCCSSQFFPKRSENPALFRDPVPISWPVPSRHYHIGIQKHSRLIYVHVVRGNTRIPVSSARCSGLSTGFIMRLHGRTYLGMCVIRMNQGATNQVTRGFTKQLFRAMMTPGGVQPSHHGASPGVQITPTNVSRTTVKVLRRIFQFSMTQETS